jgi:hypothetical protein
LEGRGLNWWEWQCGWASEGRRKWEQIDSHGQAASNMQDCSCGVNRVVKEHGGDGCGRTTKQPLRQTKRVRVMSVVKREACK